MSETAATPSRLSLRNIEDALKKIDPVFLHTPQFDSEPLSEQLGCSLCLKIETLNPIRSFKGRGASFFVNQLQGSDGRLVCASAGNFGQALAYSCRSAGIPLVVFAARSANPLKVERMRALGADVRLVGSDFDEAKAAASTWSGETGARLVVDGLEPAISEGAGTIAVELLAQGEAPDLILLPVGNGALLNGVALWAKAVSPRTRIIGVCSDRAPVMALAFRTGQVVDSPLRSATPATIADGIAVRVAIPEAVTDMAGRVDDILLVSDDDLVRAMKLLHRHVGLVIEPAGAAGMAALLAFPALVQGRRVATVLCGSNLTPAQVSSLF